MEKIFEIVDLFCGGGGTTEGFKRAVVDGFGIAKVVACINHDKFAIESHFENHPDCVHFTEDIRNFDVNRLPETNPENYSVLWASLECTNFSKAKGGKPRDADSRTLANHLFKYITHMNPDYIMIENVREFMAWGDIDENGKPVKMDKGKKYMQWVKKIEKMGYVFDYRLLNCADFGAPQSRQRFFGLFSKEGYPSIFPEPTHSKKGGDLFGQKKWEAVGPLLDLEDEGKSIFPVREEFMDLPGYAEYAKELRKKYLSDNTDMRILEGVRRYGRFEDFIFKYNSARATKNGLTFQHSSSSTETVSPAISTHDRVGVVGVKFLSKYFSGKPQHKNISIEGPAGSVMTKDHHAIINTQFITQRYSGKNRNMKTDRPTGSVTTSDHHHIVNADFLMKYHTTGKNLVGMDEPSSALSTKDRLAYVLPVHYMDLQFSQGTRNQSLDKPSQGLTTIPKHNLVSTHFLIDRQYNNKAKSIDKPARTVLATEGKKPMYLITATAAIDDDGNAAILIFEDESDVVKELKHFMAENGIIDIKMRMLKVVELKRIMGLQDDYKLSGTQEKQKWMIGNMVHPIIPEKWAIALWNKLKDWEIKKAA